MNTNENHEQAAWGVKVNTINSSSPSQKCPSWANEGQSKRWRGLGVVVWDQEQQQIALLYTRYALELLNELRRHSEWQQESIIVGEPTIRLELELLGVSSNQERKGEPSLIAQAAINPEGFLTNTIRLTGAQTRHLLEVLERHEYSLRQWEEFMNEAVNAVYPKDLLYVHKQVFNQGFVTESRKINIDARPVPWTFDEKSMTWTCTIPPNRVTVSADLDYLSWRGCLEQPGEHKLPSPSFAKLEDAFAWAEDKIQTIDKAAPTEVSRSKRQRLTLATLTPEHRERLGPYWIEPSLLEPKSMTYRAVISLVHKPIKSEAIEKSFSEKFYFNKEFPTERQLARKLNLDPNVVSVEASLTGRFDITSLTTFAERAAAEAQAQRLWDTSRITSYYQANEITGAVYGAQEVETFYWHKVGWVGDDPQRTIDRAAFFAEKAFRLTLAYAMDVDGVRAAFGWDAKAKSDEDVLYWIHTTRSGSLVIPEAVREESWDWWEQYTLRRKQSRSTARRKR